MQKANIILWLIFKELLFLLSYLSIKTRIYNSDYGLMTFPFIVLIGIIFGFLAGSAYADAEKKLRDL